MVLWCLNGFPTVDIELNIDVEGVVLIDLVHISPLAHGCYITIISEPPKNILGNKNYQLT